MLIRFAIFTLNYLFVLLSFLSKRSIVNAFLCFSLPFAAPFNCAASFSKASISDISLLLFQALKSTKIVLIKTQAGVEIFPKDRGSS
jgi:hypothetical protein